MFKDEWIDELFKGQKRQCYSGMEIVNLNDPQPDPMPKPELYVRQEQEIKYPIDSKTIPGLRYYWTQAKYKITRDGGGKHCVEVEGYIGFNGNMGIRRDEDIYRMDHLPTGFGIGYDYCTAESNSFAIAETICEEFVNCIGPELIASEDPILIKEKIPYSFTPYVKYCCSNNANIKYDEWQKQKIR